MACSGGALAQGTLRIAVTAADMPVLRQVQSRYQDFSPVNVAAR
jgi:S-adenosylhomocysteine hydrolase